MLYLIIPNQNLVKMPLQPKANLTNMLPPEICMCIAEKSFNLFFLKSLTHRASSNF